MSLGVGIVGFGFMGRLHAAAYQRHGARLVAVCDPNAEALAAESGASGNIGTPNSDAQIIPASALPTGSVDAMLAIPGLDMVSVCTPTDTHAEIAIAALRAGKHVLIEKPVALDPGTIERIARVASEHERLCMPAMCMRFWPAWAWLKRAIDGQSYGRVRSARFERLGAAPDWNAAFYTDDARSGGALFDLHIHDADFVVHAFGAPSEVVSRGDARHVTTAYRIDGGPEVTAEGGWIGAPGWPFRMRYTVVFEHAVADFELGRSVELALHLPDGTTGTPDLPGESGWDVEIRAMLEAVSGGAAEPPVTLRDAAAVTRVLLAERESLRAGRAVAVS